MKTIGAKKKEWFKARRKLVADLKKTGEYQIINGYRVFGVCKDCGHFHELQPDHKIKRSQGGSHTKENIDWVCNEIPCVCHDKRDNQGDPMKKKPESTKNKKPDWAMPHHCKSCGRIVSMFICNHCGKASV